MIEWYWILLIVATIFVVPYLWGMRAIVKRSSPANNEKTPTIEAIADCVLALDTTVERLDDEVKELKNHGKRKT